MDKKGEMGNQVFGGFGYLMLLLILGVGIVGDVAIFYGKDIDCRGVEAKQMSWKIENCILQGKVELDKIPGNEDYFYEKCGINRATAEKYFVIGVKKDGQDIFKLKDTVSCSFEGTSNNLYFPACSKERFEEGSHEIEVIAGSIQQIRRVS